MTAESRLLVWDCQLKYAMWFLVFNVAALLITYGGTVVSIIRLWYESNTFSHGLLIFPISLALVYRNREQIVGLTPKPSMVGLVALCLLVFTWFLAHSTNTRVIEQFSVIAMIPALVLFLLGKDVVNEIKFPLFYLIFAVPAGEGLIPYMMEFTAAFTVKALQITGIPVYRDGLYFSIPSGDFEVAQACSGVRYLIASVALGTLYAFLNYASLLKRTLFITASFIVPIIANGIRAYGIVLIAHFSNMRLAAGVDHILYGWLFFGLVMFLLFLFGSRYRETIPRRLLETGKETIKPKQEKCKVSKIYVSSVVAIALIVTGPLVARYRHTSSQSNATQIALKLPMAAAGWEGPSNSVDEWSVSYSGANQETSGSYRRGDDSRVDVYVLLYRDQKQGLEMINSSNQVYDGKIWSLVGEKDMAIELGSGLTLSVTETDLRLRHRKRLVWHWYKVGNMKTTSRNMAKIYEVLGILDGSGGDEYTVAISTEYDNGRNIAEGTLLKFLKDNHLQLERSMGLRTQNGAMVD